MKGIKFDVQNLNRTWKMRISLTNLNDFN